MKKIVFRGYTSNFFEKYFKIINLLLIVTIIFSFSIIFFFKREYDFEYKKFSNLKDQYQLVTQLHDVPLYENKSIQMNFADFDLLMSARPDNVNFDRIGSSSQKLMQVEGTAAQLADIDLLINNAEVYGLKLQINQVKTDDEQIHFIVSKVS